MKTKIIILLALTIILSSFSIIIAQLSFAEKIEAAHEKETFLSNKAVQFDFVLTFGGSERMNGKITLLTNSTKGLIELADGNKIYYVEDKVFYSPGIENTARIRFDAYTWSYFFLIPYKLSDPGTVWNKYPASKLNGKAYETQKLTFEQGTGDTPDDWYIVYADSKTNLLSAVAYIVTAGKSKEEAEASPSAIEYTDYTRVNGVPIATNWNFWKWHEDNGLTKKRGEAAISNIRFKSSLAGDFFNPPANFYEAKP